MPAADLQASFNRFFDASASFFRHLSEIEWTTFAIALLFLLYRPQGLFGEKIIERI